MTQPAIRIANLSKRYRLGGQAAIDRTFGEMLVDSARALTGRLRGHHPPRRQPFWALRDVSLDIAPGEVIGVVGSNGAGKSTLLKILSNITEPTEGYVELNGRVGSLLEVGTGFHPELTGRENIYLNGAILGMRRREVKRNFDAIVDFSGVEKFLDTPVKRYSSGMRVRLAFAVAAHLEPEILLVDEVLSVGDAEFQRKCLGKMQDVARGQGRTVLFVSHNMPAVQALCSRCVLLERGQVTMTGEPEEVVTAYHASVETAATGALDQVSQRSGSGAVRFVDLQWTTPSRSTASTELVAGEDVTFSVAVDAGGQEARQVNVSLVFNDDLGVRLFTCATRHVGDTISQVIGRRELRCTLPNLPLAPGRYRMDLWASVEGAVADHVESAAVVNVVGTDLFGTGRLPSARKHGPLLVEHHWDIAQRTPGAIEQRSAA